MARVGRGTSLPRARSDGNRENAISDHHLAKSRPPPHYRLAAKVIAAEAVGPGCLSLLQPEQNFRHPATKPARAMEPHVTADAEHDQPALIVTFLAMVNDQRRQHPELSTATSAQRPSV